MPRGDARARRRLAKPGYASQVRRMGFARRTRCGKSRRCGHHASLPRVIPVARCAGLLRDEAQIDRGEQGDETERRLEEGPLLPGPPEPSLRARARAGESCRGRTRP